MAINIETHTVHTIVIDLPDDLAGKIEDGDEVLVVLNGRGGQTTPKKLTYRDTERLTSDEYIMPRRPKANLKY